METRSTALSGYLNCNGVAETEDEIPLNSSICGVDEFIEYGSFATSEVDINWAMLC